MLNKLVWGTYKKSDATERKAFLEEADRMVREYGWQDKTVMPYSYPVKVTKILDDFREFDKCTSGSKCYLIELVNGLVEILNAWEQHELRRKVRFLFNGKELVMTEDWIEAMEAIGAVRI